MEETSSGRNWTAQIKRTLVSWHILSVTLLLLALANSFVTCSNVDQDVSSSAGTSSQVDLLVTTTPENSSSNASDTSNGPQAADCTVDVEKVCQDGNVECQSLDAECIDCNFNTSCHYGVVQKITCTPKPKVNCSGVQSFEREYDCRYCYQLPHWQTWCNQTIDCALNKPRIHYPARPFFVSTCWAKSEYLCMGRRCFHKQLPCNWSQGYKWSTAMLLSIFLGGFGVDRFYLGLWREGIGKLLSFGGLGVWTLVDVILIAVGYIGPWDGSLYI